MELIQCGADEEPARPAAAQAVQGLPQRRGPVHYAAGPLQGILPACCCPAQWKGCRDGAESSDSTVEMPQCQAAA